METDLLVASADEAAAAIRRAGGRVEVPPFDIPSVAVRSWSTPGATA
jgi:predicted enzyme related to lactoylglutathione lyase